MMENELEPGNMQHSLSDEAIVRELLTELACPANECICEYEAGRLVSLHIRCALSIDHLPPAIFRLRHLRVLRLSGQWKLTELPPEIGQLESLERLEMSECRLSSLPPEIGKLSTLQTLRIQDTRRLTQIPAEVGRLTGLSTLSLAGNRLTQLPAEIGQLESLVVLDLSSNELRDLPLEPGGLSNLRSLDLSYNLLDRLPMELSQLSALEILRLEHNELTELPPELGQLASLTSLTLDGNRLTALPPQLGQLRRLLTLTLEHNELSALPEELARLPELEQLKLTNNRLDALPQALAQMPYLHPLKLDGNPLEQITPDLLTRLTTLPAFGEAEYWNEHGEVGLTFERVQYEEIWLEQERFYLIDAGQANYLPKNLDTAPALPIEVNFNQVSLLSSRRHQYVWVRLEYWDDEPPLPAGDWELAEETETKFHLSSGSPGVGSVYFCDTLGEKVSRPFGVGEANRYYSIRVFCRGRAQAFEAPSEGGHAPRGYEQYLFQFWQFRPKKASGHYTLALTMQEGRRPDPTPLPEDGKILEQMAARLKRDPQTFGRYYRGGQIVELGFGSEQLPALEAFPPELLELTHLATLYLGGRQLTRLWPEIGLLTNLKSLSLSDNRLTTLPPEIGLLTNLESLEVRKNQLSSLPPEIGLLSKLVNLNLESNQLRSLPSEIGQLHRLKGLHLNWNQLSSLPPEIGQLTQLNQLSLTSNPLQSLPPELGALQQLRTLEAQNSFTLAYLPPELGALKQLHGLDLSYNNLQYLPREIGEMRQLRSLSLKGNWLQAVPRQIGQLPHLVGLDLSLNRLTELPREIEQLSSLTSLRLEEEPLVSKLTERLRGLVPILRRPERQEHFFETGPYYDSSGNQQHPDRMVCAEINVDYSQFYLGDAHERLECDQQGIVDGWVQTLPHHLSLLSTTQYHYALVRMEAWEQEPPALQEDWELTSELSVLPHAGIVVLAELMGGTSVALELMPGREPGCTYRLRASSRGRGRLAEVSATWWDDHDVTEPFPHGIEQYLLQFWPIA